MSINSCKTSGNAARACRQSAFHFSPLQDNVEAIVLATLASLQGGGHKTWPHILLFGEDHSNPHHLALKMAVIDELANNGVRLAIGLEEEHNKNYAARAMRPAQNILNAFHAAFAGTTQGKASQASTGKQTASSAISAREMAASIVYSDASWGIWSNRSLRHYLFQNSITTFFNDAAMKHHTAELDLDNQATATVARDLYPDVTEFKPYDRESYHVRNVFMCRQVLSQVKDLQTDLYVMSVGNSHVAGLKGKSPYNHSLAYLFRDGGLNVTAVPVFDEFTSYRNLPDDIALENHNAALDIRTQTHCFDLNNAGLEHFRLHTALKDTGMEAYQVDRTTVSRYRAWLHETRGTKPGL